MEFQIALNTIILLMMVVFPGFLFRKFYFVGEFTKQFNQGTQFDKLVWNIFFSSIAILFTILSIFVFKNFTNLPLMESISYDSIIKIVKPLQKSDIPDKEILYQMYKDLIILVSLIYTFASFLGMICHFIVRKFRLDINFPIFRFSNHWYYYIHGGRILYNNKENRKRMFTFADVLCEEGGESKLYSGILSQYVINRENNQLENIYLTNAIRYKRILAVDGTTSVETKSIQGNTFCVPYSRVLNLNFTYYYSPVDKLRKKRIGYIINDTVFTVLILSIAISMFFNLSDYGINGIIDKIGYLFLGLIFVLNLRILLATIFSLDVEIDKPVVDTKKEKLQGAIMQMFLSFNWLFCIIKDGSFWLYVLSSFFIAIALEVVFGIIDSVKANIKKMKP